MKRTTTMIRWLLLLVLFSFAAAEINQDGLDFLAKKEKEPGVSTLASGVMYTELVAGEGNSPEMDTVCGIYYSTSLVNGTVFDSSFEQEQPMRIAPVQVPSEWTQQGLLGMKQGSKWEFYLTPEVAGVDQMAMASLGVPAGSVLIYTLELVEISNIRATQKGPNKEGQAFLASKKEEKGVNTLESGLMYKERIRGTGDSPEVDRVCALHYTATFINGTKFHSTRDDNGQYLEAAPKQVIKGMREALQKMKEGAVWEIYIRPDMGFSNRLAGKEIPPGHVLIYNLELLAILDLRVEVFGPSPEDEEFLNDMRADPDVVELASGLLVKEIMAGTGESPRYDSPCTIQYNSSFANGTKILSSYEQGKPLVASPMEVSLKGLREALYLMQEGGKMEVYIPSELGYGEKGVEGLIHEGAVLIYELELVEVGKPESVSAGITIDGVSLEGAEFLEEKKGEKGVVTLPSGLMYKEITEGTGKTADIDSQVRIHYFGQFIDGKEFDSTYDRGEPVVISPQEVIPGWTEALQLMKEGAKWKLFIPPQLGYGERGAAGIIPGGAVLVFTVTLLEVLDVHEKDEL